MAFKTRKEEFTRWTRQSLPRSQEVEDDDDAAAAAAADDDDGVVCNHFSNC